MAKIDYADVLDDLEARRDDIDAAIRAVKALIPARPGPKAGKPKTVSHVGFSGRTFPQPGDLDYEDSLRNQGQPK